MSGGVPPSGSGHSPKGEAAISVASPAKPSVPNAEQRILAAVKRALEPLNSPGMTWPEYYRRVQAAPDRVLHELRESEVLFRTSEQANWPLLVEAFSRRPYTLTIRTQLTIGAQTFGYDQQADALQIYAMRMPRDLAIHMGKRAIRATLEAVGEPYFEEATRQIASVIEAFGQDREDGLDAKHESAVGNAETPSLHGGIA